MDSLLQRLNIKSLNDMQLSVQEKLTSQRNLVLISPTGSGKTIAYLLAALKHITKANRIQLLILAPSRELVLQIESVVRTMQSGFKTTVCYGGHKREIEETTLVETPEIIIGTPGRLGDHIRRKNIELSQLTFLVVDEFDKCLELGFEEEMEFIFSHIPNEVHKLFTSATRLESLPEFTKMSDATTLSYISDIPGSDKLTIRTVHSEDPDKIEILTKLLCFAGNTSSIIFCNHRDAVERVSHMLKDKQITNVFYHGGMEQIQRETALAKFRNGSSDVLVTTDLASRGLDIADIRNIIHYHLPLDEASFIHRNGRTARMHNTGIVYILQNSQENLPEFIPATAEQFLLPENISLPSKPSWVTLFIAAGKKHKVNKVDIVGFLSKKGDLKSEEIGLIEVKDFSSFVAVRRSKVAILLNKVQGEKIKNQKVKIAIAK